MKTKLLFTLIIVLTTFLNSADAQTNCNLQTSDASITYNLKLGMSPEEINSQFGPDLKVKIKKNEQKTFFQNFIKKPAPNSLSGARAVYLRFFNRRLYQIEIFYENQARWPTLTDFTGDLSANLNLPASAWENVKNKQVINCPQATIVADYILNPRIEMTDPVVFAEVEKQRSTKKE